MVVGKGKKGTSGKVKASDSPKPKRKENKRTGFFTNEWNKFRDSFTKIDMNFLFAAIIDVCFYGLVFLAIMLYGKYFENRMSALGPDALNSIQSGMAPAPEALSQLKSITNEYMILTTLLFLGTFLLFVLAKLAIYQSMINKKPGLPKYWWFVLLNLFWTIVGGVILIALGFLIEDQSFTLFGGMLQVKTLVMIFALLLILHLGYISYYSFVRDDKKRIRTALVFSWNTGIEKIHWFLVPYLIGILVFIAINLLTYGIGKILPSEVYIVVVLIIVLFMVTWFRQYLIRCLRDTA